MPRVGALLRPTDFSWLVGAGIVLPYVYMMVINRFTPLGGRDWGLKGVNLILPAAQFLGLACLMCVVPVRVARWRLAIRAAALGLGGGHAWGGWLAVLAAAVSIPLSGWLAAAEYQRDIYQPVAIVLVALPAGWLLVAVLRALVGTAKPRLLARGVIARALVPVYATAMLLLAVAAPCHKAAERSWFQCDTLLRMDPAFPAMSPYEYRVAKQLRQEIRAILGLQP